MRVIILNKRRIGVTAIILGLMMVLFGLEKTFDAKLKQTALLYNNISSFAKYEGLEKSFSYTLPDGWKSNEENLVGGEVIYHNNFTSSDSVIYGFVQVWNYKGDLKTFLDNSKESIFNPKEVNYKDYEISSINLKGINGYVVSYNMEVGSKKNYRSYDYFIPDKDRFYRFTFFIDDASFRETMPSIFNTIVSSLEYKK